MHPHTQTGVLKDLTAARYGRGAALVSGMLGALALIGWTFEIPSLTSLSAGLPSMKPNTALLMLIAAACLWLIVGSTQRRDALAPSRHRSRAVVAVLACIVGLAALVTLAQDVFGIDVGIDQLFWNVLPSSVVAHAARMSPVTASLFALLALAFLLRPARQHPRLHVADVIATLVGFIGYLTLVAYVYNIQGLYQIEGLNSIALSTAVAFQLLATGFVIGRPHSIVARRLMRTATSGLMLRRLLPAAWIVPPAIGWLRLLGQQHGLYGTEFGIGLLATSCVAIFVTLVWWTSGSVEESEGKRLAAESKLRAEVSGLDLLNRITRSMVERKEIDAVYEVAVGALGELFATDIACICDFTDEVAVLRVRAMSRSAGTGTPGELLDLTRQGELARSREELIYEPSAVEDPTQDVPYFAAIGIRSVMAVPLRTQTGAVGVLIVGRRPAEAFTQVDREFLRQLGDNIALAVQRTQLYSSLKSAYDDLRKTQAVLTQRARLRALGEMASGVAHDINNTLSPITVYADSLIRDEPGISEQGRAHLEIMRGALADIANTVARLRDFSRPKEATDNHDSIDLNALVTRLVEFTRPRWRDQPIAAGRQIDLRTQLAPGLPPIAGSSDEVGDALTNLIFNAVDALPAGGCITVRTRLERAGTASHVVLEVADDGTGMDEATRMKCLEPFFTTKGDRGTGLGLASVFGMLQRIGGQLHIDSALGQGTAVVLRFVAASVRETPLDTGAPTAALPGALVRGLRILLIDDDPIVLQAMAFLLKGEGHDVTAAKGGEAGIEAFAESHSRGRPYAVVLTDLGMPRIDGKKVASRVKSLSPATPVVMLTGWGRRMIEERDTPGDVDRVLSKPPKPGELQRVLAQIASQEPLGSAAAC